MKSLPALIVAVLISTTTGVAIPVAAWAFISLLFALDLADVGLEMSENLTKILK